MLRGVEGVEGVAGSLRASVGWDADFCGLKGFSQIVFFRVNGLIWLAPNQLGLGTDCPHSCKRRWPRQ